MTSGERHEDFSPETFYQPRIFKLFSISLSLPGMAINFHLILKSDSSFVLLSCTAAAAAAVVCFPLYSLIIKALT